MMIGLFPFKAMPHWKSRVISVQGSASMEIRVISLQGNASLETRIFSAPFWVTSLCTLESVDSLFEAVYYLFIYLLEWWVCLGNILTMLQWLNNRNTSVNVWLL